MVDANPAYISRLSPWDTVVSDDKSAAIVYSYDADEGTENIALYRLVRDDKGNVTDVYGRVARREVESRTLPTDSPDYEDAVYELANDDSKKKPSLPPCSSGWARPVPMVLISPVTAVACLSSS